MNQTLVSFEGHLLRDSTQTARILGMSYSSYIGYRSSGKELPRYLALHIDTLLRLPSDALQTVVRERLTHGGS